MDKHVDVGYILSASILFTLAVIEILSRSISKTNSTRTTSLIRSVKNIKIITLKSQIVVQMYASTLTNVISMLATVFTVLKR